MKQSGKKFLILLISILTISSVKALNVGDKVYFPNNYNMEKYGFISAGSGVGGYQTRYYVKQVNGRNLSTDDRFALYCLDPSAKTGGRTQKIKKILDPNKPLDAGLLYILKAKASTYGITGPQMYSVKSIATRVFIWRDKELWNSAVGYSGCNYDGKKNAMYGQSKIWDDMAEFKDITKEEMKKANMSGITTSTKAVMNVAYQLYKEAVKIFNELTENPTSNPLIHPRVQVTEVLKEHFAERIQSYSDPITGEEYQKRYVVVRYLAQNFSNQEKYFRLISNSATENNIKVKLVGISNKAHTSLDNYEKYEEYQILNQDLFKFLADTEEVIPATEEGGEPTKKVNKRGYITVSTEQGVEVNNLEVYAIYEVATKITDKTNFDKDCDNKLLFKYKFYDASGGQGIWVGSTKKSSSLKTSQRFVGYTDDPIEQIFTVNTVTCDDKCYPVLEMPTICKDNENVDENGDVTYKFTEGNDIDNKLNIKRCILEKSDINGNDYQLIDEENASALTENPFCKVYCKEDYSFTLPYKKYVNNGRYMNISLKISGRQDCYSTKLDETLLRDYIEDSISRFSNGEVSLENAKVEIDELITQYNACAKNESETKGTGWDLSYTFEPDIKYDYNEPYDEYSCPTEKWMDKVRELQADKMVDVYKNISDVTVEYCDGEIENDYTCKGTKTNNIQTKQGSYLLNGQTYTYDYVTADYVHKYATVDSEYDTPRVFYSVHPTGRIEISKGNIENADIVGGLPIGFNTPNGKYFYILSFSNIGKYYNLNQLGRIFGTDNDTSGGKKSLSNMKNESTVTVGGETCTNKETVKVTTNSYACTYTVDANACKDEFDVLHTEDECNPGEEWGKCMERICKCPKCEIIYIERVKDFNVRPITPSNINPNNRDLGLNWNTDEEENANHILANKAQNTISEIEDRANASLEDLKEIDEYSFEVKLTPNMISDIKKYNNEHKSKGNYSNETLECFDYTIPQESDKLDYSKLDTDMANKLRKIATDKDECLNAGYRWENDSCIMKNIFCYSKFIDTYYTEYPENFNKEIMSVRENSKKQVINNKTMISSSRYGAVLTTDYWTIYEYTTLDVTGDKMADIGPSWK